MFLCEGSEQLNITDKNCVNNTFETLVMSYFWYNVFLQTLCEGSEANGDVVFLR